MFCRFNCISPPPLFFLGGRPRQHPEKVFKRASRNTAETNQKPDRKEIKVEQEVARHTAFSKASYDLSHSERVMDELTFGRRVGFYELRGEIGSGNFSHVRLGIHDLTKGESGFAKFTHWLS